MHSKGKAMQGGYFEPMSAILLSSHESTVLALHQLCKKKSPHFWSKQDKRLFSWELNFIKPCGESFSKDLRWFIAPLFVSMAASNGSPSPAMYSTISGDAGSKRRAIAVSCVLAVASHQ